MTEAGPSTVPVGTLTGTAPAWSRDQVPFAAQMEERTTTIHEGDQVMLELPSTVIKVIMVKKGGNISLGKFGTFPCSELIDKPYGIRYEIIAPESDSSTEATDPPTSSKTVLRPLQSVQVTADASIETTATNELIEDGKNQLLTSEDIEKLKKEGVKGEEIIKRQIEMHKSFELKTEFSKDKYRKRKAAKFSNHFLPLAPTMANILKYLNLKSPQALQYMREDTLAQILSFGNVRPGGRYLVCDDTGGAVVGSMIERMGGIGQILTLTDVESPPTFNIASLMNLPPKALESTLLHLNWAVAEENYVPVSTDSDELQAIVNDTSRKERDKERARRKLHARKEVQDTREALYAAEWDGLIVASEYEPYGIVEKLGKYVSGSGTVVVYSPFAQILVDCQAQMRSNPIFLNASLTESWLRKWQVLPGRTHPFMSMSGSGGYLLSAIRVLPDDTTTSVLAGRSAERARARERKRAKLDPQAIAVAAAAVADASGSDIATPTGSASVDEDLTAAEDVDIPAVVITAPVEDTTATAVASEIDSEQRPVMDEEMAFNA